MLRGISQHIFHGCVGHRQSPGHNATHLRNESTFDPIVEHADQLLAQARIDHLVHHNRQTTTLKTAAGVVRGDVLVTRDTNQTLWLKADNLFAVLALSTQGIRSRRQLLQDVHATVVVRLVCQQQKLLTDQVIALKFVGFDDFQARRVSAVETSERHHELLHGRLAGATRSYQVQESFTCGVSGKECTGEGLDQNFLPFVQGRGDPPHELRTLSFGVVFVRKLVT